MERYYDATAGKVEFDGVDVKELNVKWLRDQIGTCANVCLSYQSNIILNASFCTGLVSQEAVLFDASIRENILYGCCGCPTASQEEIEEACRRANAHDFICKFPDGKILLGFVFSGTSLHFFTHFVATIVIFRLRDKSWRRWRHAFWWAKTKNW